MSDMMSGMMSMQEMFYGEREEVWIMKPEKKEKEDGKKAEPPPKPPPPTPQENNFGPLFPHYQKPYTPPPAPPKKPAPATKTVELKVDICCEECEELVTLTLTPVKGVEKITYDIAKEKVTVVIKNDTSPDDILIECRKAFRKSRLWTKED